MLVLKKNQQVKTIKKEEIMKKILFVVLVFCVIALIGICGCSKASSPTSSAPAATNTPTINIPATQTAIAGLPSATQTYIAQQTMTAAVTATYQAQQTLTAAATATSQAQATATAQAQATATAGAGAGIGTISGTITLPASLSGEYLQILAFTGSSILAVANGNGPQEEIQLGSATSIPYSITVTAGASYFVLAATTANSNGGPPSVGDDVGIYGGTYPASFPSSPNVAVTKNTTTSGISFTMGTVSNTINGTITLPASVTSKNYIVAVYSSAQSFVDGQNFDNNGDIGDTSGTVTGNTITYTIPALLPGTLYVSAWVDNDSNGQISTGDYVGNFSLGNITPANNYINENFTLTTQP